MKELIGEGKVKAARFIAKENTELYYTIELFGTNGKKSADLLIKARYNDVSGAQMVQPALS
jgi:hypothetical protein